MKWIRDVDKGEENAFIMHQKFLDSFNEHKEFNYEIKEPQSGEQGKVGIYRTD